MTSYVILPQLPDKPPAVAMVIQGHVFSECPRCGAVRSINQDVTAPYEVRCKCGQRYEVTLRADS